MPLIIGSVFMFISNRSRFICVPLASLICCTNYGFLNTEFALYELFNSWILVNTDWGGLKDANGLKAKARSQSINKFGFIASALSKSFSNCCVFGIWGNPPPVPPPPWSQQFGAATANFKPPLFSPTAELVGVSQSQGL